VIAKNPNLQHHLDVSNKRSKAPEVAPPAATGSAGPQFEGKVGAFYLLSLLVGGEPRGLPGAIIRAVAFQQRGSGRPLDDVVIQAINADGSQATLEIQAKRTLTFTATDAEFKDVVAQMWAAAQKSEFASTRYELAVAIARTTTKVELSCQEVLHWARQLPDGATFAAHINLEGFSSKGMRDFVGVFRSNLLAAGAPTDYDTVWRLLRRFQILVFDFESYGSDYEHRARERARLTLVPAQANRATALWPILIDQADASARAGGAQDRNAVLTPLNEQYGFQFDQRADLRTVDARLSEAASRALGDIKDQVGGARLARTELVDQAYGRLEQRRILHIVGGPGVGKSAIMKDLAERLEPEGRIVVLGNGRIIAGGWLQMSHVIGCPVSQDELFNELGCGGGATLFIDNIDQIDEAGEWATVSDLLAGVAKCPGWRAVVTGGAGNDTWKTKLSDSISSNDIGTLEVAELSDDETAALSQQNHALAIILGAGHPAREIARNLFYLSRMVELGASQIGPASTIATEIDLARLWWRYGAGRSEDAGRLARLKVLRAMGAQFVANPVKVSFKTDDFDSATVADLLRFDSLREDIRGATVAFRHDVLRDWTVGFLLHEDQNGEILKTLPIDQPLSTALARGIEIAARLAIESDATGARWVALLDVVQHGDSHGSWRRPVLLALPRAEQALALFESLKSVLLANDGRLLGEIIRLMIAVESVPIAKLIERAQPSVKVPPGVGDMVVPKGIAWTWLVVWLVSAAPSLPTALIPDVTKVFQAWLISTQNQARTINAMVVQILFDWLALIENRISPRFFRDPKDVPSNLNIPHVNEARDEIRMTVFAFAHLNHAAAQNYLSHLDQENVTYHDTQDILRAPGTLARAAPVALVDFVLGALIEKEDPDALYRSRRNRYGPFSVHEHLFSPASPGQGPFFDLLESAPAEGLRLIRAVVEHATQWRREQYAEAREPFPRLSIRFPTGTKSFEGDWSVYHWARSIAPSVTVASALMALEAWGHRQIDAGRPFEDVLHDVLGPDGCSIAFVCVAVDLVLSHWPEAADVAWPVLATPEVLEFDDARVLRDLAGVDRMTLEQESATWRVKRAELDAKPSRRARLSDQIGHYVFHGKPGQLEALRAALEQARNEIKQRRSDHEDPVKGLTATAERAVRMTDAQHWPLVKVTSNDGSEVEAHQFQRDLAEQELMDEKAKRAQTNLRHQNVRMKLQEALLDRAKSSAELVAEGIEWAKSKTAKEEPQATDENDDDDENEDYNKEWNKRAVVTAAALAARDYEGADRAEVIDWALSVLQTAATEKGREYPGNDQIEYNATAIAALGLLALYLKDHQPSLRDTLLRLASHQHLSVVAALGRNFSDLAQVDPRLPRSLIRIVMAASIHPYRADNDEQNRLNQQAYRDSVNGAIAAERNWLNGTVAEPDWPELPPWLSRPRRGIRLGGGRLIEEDNENEEQRPDQYVDEHTLGALTGYLIRFTVGDLPDWLLAFAEHLMRWTCEANGPHGDDDRDRDNPPLHWNGHFFDFLGILCVALPHDVAVAKFIEPITRFNDEAFHDCMAEFLRGFDRAMQAIDRKKPDNPVAVRELLAERIQKGWNYKRLGCEKGMTSETHAGDALNAMFYQPHRIANRGQPSIPANWKGLDANMPVLVNLVASASTSGYIATLFLNLIDSSPRAVLLPFLVEALKAWCAAYGVDRNFWAEKGFGGRVSTWLDRTFSGDAASAIVLPRVKDDLLKCLDVLIRSGVAQAREIEQRIANLGASS
jgi:hypothetical protein